MTGPANSLNITQPGYVVFDGVSVFTGRTFQAGAGITLSNASGIVGNTTISVTGGAAVTSVLTANATPQFALVGTTETVDFNLTNLNLGSTMPSVTSGTANVGFGPGVFGALTSGSNNVGIGNLSAQSIINGASNVIIGFGAGRFVTSGSANTFIGTSSGGAATSGNSNTGLGQAALGSYTTGAAGAGSNTAVGATSLTAVTSGTLNTALGTSSGASLTIGTNNILIGNQAGASYTTSESSNILIGAAGTIAESNVMRLGTQGSGAGQQLQTFIAGVVNTVSGRVVKTTVPGAYPYTTLTTDYVILVDTSSARTINLVASPVTGTTYRIKDNVGTAAANNITVTPNAGTIDGAATFTMNVNWESIDIVYNGTSWRIL